jgi:hypothetical protein
LLKVVPFDEEDESPFVGLLQVEAAKPQFTCDGSFDAGYGPKRLTRPRAGRRPGGRWPLTGLLDPKEER